MEAHEALRDLAVRYTHAADTGRFDEVAALFAREGDLILPDGRTIHGRAAIREFLGGQKADLQDTTASSLVRHFVTNHRIDVTSATEATGALYFLVITDRGLDHWGRYRDAYVVEDGRWRFRERKVRLEGWTPGSWAGERRK